MPPPLPPETRTVGQLVAETIRFYGAHFWRSIALGIGPAGVIVLLYRVGWQPAIAGAWVAWTVAAAGSFVGACALAAPRPPAREELARGFAVGVVVALPGVVLAPVCYPLFGLGVPAALHERLGVRAALRRGAELARADYVHTFGSVFALGIVVALTQGLLFTLIRGGSGQTSYIAAFLAAVVVQPLLFIGGALLYVDQAARAPGRGRPSPAEPGPAGP